MAGSSKKDKLLEEAQKLSLRGQFDKAAKAYEQVVALEPAAINHRQKLAELLVKSGQLDAARKEFETIGKHFTKNGFNQKAIAVYKQLQKLFPADISLSLTLAELNEKHGLVANALSEYKLVYEFHEKSGNIPEALAILDRMQNVDQQSIPIKVKLAETYFQHGKKEESYSVFTKTASLLLERGDNATLAKISARIKQIFPEKPDFMLETLAGQLRLGKAASAVSGLQNALRNNPNNKNAWDLMVQAYQMLDQPQRVKVAYQHYLKFFPDEPTAMHGLIASVTAEQDLKGAMELLDQYEARLITAGFSQQLEQTYRSLDKIDPINTRVLEGFIRAAAASGNEGEVASLKSRLHSISSVTDRARAGSVFPEADPVIIEETALEVVEPGIHSFFDDSFSEGAGTEPNDAAEKSTFPEEAALNAPFSEPAAIDAECESDIEIDIDFDIDSPFNSPEQDTASAHDNWLDSVGNLFDTIDTAPRSVKFGADMENSDAQSHFDLGQAFKEMGLYDEAIKEFRQASQDPLRRVECLIMQCACLRERGELEKAISMLQTLLKPELNAEESCAVKYELATGYESAGRHDEANVLLNEINAVNPSFRDIRSRINSANSSNSLDFSDDDLDEFGI